MTELDFIIIKIVKKLQRDYRRGIFPWMVQARLDIYRCEQTLRRDMARLARLGQLHRIGGENARRGYIIATRPKFNNKLNIPPIDFTKIKKSA